MRTTGTEIRSFDETCPLCGLENEFDCEYEFETGASTPLEEEDLRLCGNCDTPMNAEPTEDEIEAYEEEL